MWEQIHQVLLLHCVSGLADRNLLPSGTSFFPTVVLKIVLLLCKPVQSQWRYKTSALLQERKTLLTDLYFSCSQHGHIHTFFVGQFHYPQLMSPSARRRAHRHDRGLILHEKAPILFRSYPTTAEASKVPSEASSLNFQSDKIRECSTGWEMQQCKGGPSIQTKLTPPHWFYHISPN